MSRAADAPPASYYTDQRRLSSSARHVSPRGASEGTRRNAGGHAPECWQQGHVEGSFAGESQAPSIRTHLVRPAVPLLMDTADWGQPKCLAIRATNSVLALPSTGGDLIWASRMPLSPSVSRLRRTFGLTLTWIVFTGHGIAPRTRFAGCALVSAPSAETRRWASRPARGDAAETPARPGRRRTPMHTRQSGTRPRGRPCRGV